MFDLGCAEWRTCASLSKGGGKKSRCSHGECEFWAGCRDLTGLSYIWAASQSLWQKDCKRCLHRCRFSRVSKTTSTWLNRNYSHGIFKQKGMIKTDRLIYMERPDIFILSVRVVFFVSASVYYNEMWDGKQLRLSLQENFPKESPGWWTSSRELSAAAALILTFVLVGWQFNIWFL